MGIEIRELWLWARKPEILRVVPGRLHALLGNPDRHVDIGSRHGHARTSAQRRFAAGDTRSDQSFGRLFEHLKEPGPAGRQHLDNAGDRKATKGGGKTPRGQNDPFQDFFDRFFDSPDNAPDAGAELGFGRPGGQKGLHPHQRPRDRPSHQD